MPVLIDVQKEALLPEGARKNLSKGVPLALTEDQKSAVVLTKYISTDPLHADWQPAGEWWEQIIADVGGGRRRSRIMVSGENGQPRGVNEDDGLIINIIGTMTGQVGILAGRAPMSMEEVEAHIDATEEPVPLFQRWDFRVRSVLKTNGPQQRESLMRSEDQKKQEAQAEMFGTITAAFKQGLGAGVGGMTMEQVQEMIKAAVGAVKK